MVRQRRANSALSDDGTESTVTARGDQELGSMYDYLAKIILLGPSGSGKSCLLHRFIKNEWRHLTSQTIGVEFASKVIRIGPPNRRKRIKLQLWDTAGTERFRSVSRSYYRGAAGALLVYDITQRKTFEGIESFMHDARALASPQLTIIMVGNKSDLAGEEGLIDLGPTTGTPGSVSSRASDFPYNAGGSVSGGSIKLASQLKASVAPEGREVSSEEASRWASNNDIPVSVEVSALSGENVDEVFHRLASMILTKIELGEIDPDDPQSGIQYGDSDTWGMAGSDVGSIKSGITIDDAGRRRKRKSKGWGLGSGEWGDVFKLSPNRRRANGGCC